MLVCVFGVAALGAMSSLSCSKPGDCALGGVYTDSGGAYQAFVTP